MRCSLKKFARKSAFLRSGAEPDLTSRLAKSANQSPNQSANQSANQPPNQSPNQPANPSLSKQKSVSLQWFHDYSVRRKQLILLLPGLLSILGLAGIATLLIVMTGRAQLRQQAESELAATEINYSAKLNQMGGTLADQPIVVAAVQASVAAAAGVDANAAANAAASAAREILQTETKIRGIEYATLVGKDLQIIANANTDRKGQLFDPDQLVSAVFKTLRPLKANVIVGKPELQQEAPALPAGTTGSALIRYSVMPVREPATGAAIGALVLGEIVNGKRPIVEATLQAFAGGYSAVYLRQPTGEFVLATALQADAGSADLRQAKANISLPDQSLLERTVANQGKPTTARIDIGKQTYTVAAKALLDFNKNPVAVLVRGTPESALNSLLQRSLLLQLLFVILALAVQLWLARFGNQTMVTPLRNLQQAVQQFAAGERQVRAEVFATDEVGQLTRSFNSMADYIAVNVDSISQKEHQLQEVTEKLQVARQLAAQTVAKQDQLQAALQQQTAKLLQIIGSVNRGDLTARVQAASDQLDPDLDPDLDSGFDSGFNPEISAIAAAYNITVEHLHQIVLQVQQVADQASKTIDVGQSSVQALSSEVHQQADVTASLLNLAEEMATATQKIAADALQAEDFVQQSAQSMVESDAAIGHTINGLEMIHGTVLKTTDKVKHLGESSQQIVSAVELIDSLTVQMNLLAFSTSIEASRAGEASIGLIAVAEAVRKLAKHSEEATEDIKQVLFKLQTEISEIVLAMKSSTDQVAIGGQMVVTTFRNLNRIVAASEQMSQLMTAVTQTSVFQSQTSEAITTALKQIAMTANQTSTEANHVSTEFEQFRTLTQMLRSQVEEFKVSQPDSKAPEKIS